MQLVPKKEPQKVDYQIWESHTPGEYKLELVDGECLWGGEGRDRMALMLVYNMGLEAFTKLLPDESKQALRDLLGSG
ncbi:MULTISPECIES: hypothetical protein [Paenibacillaceae]|uniref:hypothetical protein n=1 Tax=Paenibacillaceae TaxID=186822 RepID=UPI0002A4D105|nr:MULTISPECIES: hypothetical protein [Brevibacillus]ELK40137.1 HD-GYP domain-containing protein [Brevibacillus agri BAB-2500]MCM3472196.1 hypothetical protein [Brevibacillus borstelensis]MDN4095598.1 hypothetical protein [Brevibacillus agri]QHZ58436.1 hypothetical protein M655_023900 [Brevibacillus sp. NSP2.1]